MQLVFLFSGDTALTSLCGKDTALQSWWLTSEEGVVVSFRLTPCSGHCSISQDQTPGELSQHSYIRLLT